MNKLFENTTTYNSTEYRKFLEFHNKKYSFKYNLYTLFILFLLIFCMILQFMNSNINLGCLFLTVAICFLAYRIFRPYFFVKKESNSDKVKKQLTNTYSFYDKYMEIKNRNDFIKLKYYRLYKIFETDDSFYLYMNKDYSFVLSKNGFSIGKQEDFYKFIKKKLWFRI